MKLDRGARLIVKRLEDEGYQAYLVGGAVRDYLLGRDLHDYDLATDARPEEIKKVFKDYRILEVGKKFGTMVLVLDGKNYELTSFRKESGYSDYRRPDQVVFSKNLEEDLSRRDFTINAMAYGPEGLVDPFQGQKDLKDKLIRAVGQADRRIEEDYLRALRAIRFSCQLDFNLDPDLLRAIAKKNSSLAYISMERINEEFSKILLSSRPSKGLLLLREVGLLEKILPGMEKTYDFDQRNKHHSLDLFSHSLQVVDFCPKDLELRLAGLVHDLGKVESFFLGEDGQGHFYGHEKISANLARDLLTRLRYGKKTIDQVVLLVERHMDGGNIYTEKSVRKLIRRLGRQTTLKLFSLQEADMMAGTGQEGLENIRQARAIYDKIISEDLLVDTRQLAINGHDLIAEGFSQGRFLGQLLDHLTDLVIEGKLKNERPDILAYVNKEYGEYKWKD